ncbi:MAG TPA: glycosyltransferase family 4 protein [Gaiellaceae bacterium]|nr:glycosyltransferase family 4 protein [Gaiellaceae bacterium]
MKVGMLVNELAVSGGYQKLVLRLTRELLELGHEVTLYAVVVDRDRCYPGEWPAVRVVTPEGHDTDTAARLELGRLIANDLDALIVHDEVSLSALSTFKGDARVFWMLNNELAWLRHGCTPRSLLGSGREALRCGGPRALAAAIGQERTRCVARGIARKLDGYGVYDRRNAADVKRHLGRDATLVYAGADIEAFESLSSRRHPERSTRFSVLSVGVVFPHRRYEDVIDAVAEMSKIADTELTIVGLQTLAPDYARVLRERVISLGQQEHVHFRDYVSRQELEQLYIDADAFAFVNEGLTWGIAVFEALAAGVPVIISDTVGAVDLVQSGKHGWVVPARDPAGLATALGEIYTNPERARRLTEAARRDLLDLVRWPAYAKRIERAIASPCSTPCRTTSRTT